MKNLIITLLFSVLGFGTMAQIEVNVRKDEDVFKDFANTSWAYGDAFSSKNEKYLIIKYTDINYTYL